jgi:acetyl esterase
MQEAVVNYDPDVARVLAMLKAQGRKPFTEQTVDEARASYRAACEANGLPRKQMASVRDFEARTAAGRVRVRRYRAADVPEIGAPAIVFFHGGGWVIGDLDTHDPICRYLAAVARCCVVAVDYRLAPEHVFPAAVDDALGAYRWIARNAAVLGLDANRLAVAGDSAGGSLAAMVAMAVDDPDGAAPRLQLLFYPVTDLGAESVDYKRITGGLPMVADTMRWFRDRYIPDPSCRMDWRASPLRAETLWSPAPALVVTAGHDPLCAEAVAFADRLEQEGVRVTHLHLSDQIHGFLTIGALISASTMVLDLAGAMAGRVLGGH